VRARLRKAVYASYVDRARLVDRLERVPGIVAAYLFGSRARGDEGETSDVDVGILLARTPRTFDEAPLDLAGALEHELGIAVDVVVLNDAPSDLVHRVLRDGVLLVERDRSARIRFEVRSRNEYFDLTPVRNEYRRAKRDVRT
jgi:predicted nucleotidyltransferase